MVEVKFLEPIYPELYKQLMEIRSSKGFKKTQEERMDEDLTGEVGEINKTKQDGEDTEEGRNQALRDLLFGILRDWTYIAAGRPGPWTRPSRKSLNKLFFNSAIEAEEWFGSSFTNGNRVSLRNISATELGNTSYTARPRRLATPPNTRNTRNNNATAGSSKKNNHLIRSQPPQLWENIAEQGSSQYFSSITPSPLPLASQRALSGASNHNTTLEPQFAHAPSNMADYQSTQSQLGSPPGLPGSSLQVATASGGISTGIEQTLLKAQHNTGCSSHVQTEPTPNLSPEASLAMTTRGPSWLKTMPVKVFHHITTYLTRNDLKACLETSRDFNRKFGPSWPKTMPIEVCHHIASYLTRNDLKSCLETSKDFNSKFGPSFFQQVVLPFDTETFDPVKDNDDISPGQQRVPKLDMFQSWGAHMKKVGFALEVDEDGIAQAQGRPIFPSEDSSEEPDQVWYPRTFTWPKQRSYVDPATKQLELAAEKIKPIQEAIAHLTIVDEIAFSIDNGLGYLSGPDASDRVTIIADKSEVFGRKFALSREQVLKEWLDDMADKISQFSRQDKNLYNAYEKCLRLAFPHTGVYLQFVVDFMLKYPRRSLKNINWHIDECVRNYMVNNGILTAQERVHTHRNPIDSFAALSISWPSISPQTWLPGRHLERGIAMHKHALAMFDRLQSESQLAPSHLAENLVTGPYNPDRALLARLLCSASEAALIFNGLDLNTASDERLEAIDFSAGPLLPADLTRTQNQWLKEFGWVQNAFLSSILTSIIRNKSNLTSVCNLNFAKLSSSFLSRLYDNDLWTSLPNVKKVTIMVSPEWRDIDAGYDGEFRSHSVSPSNTVSSFYKLIIVLSGKRHIETLTLGYVGGGEHATGLFGRNKHLLSAPVVDHSTETSILTLPHVKNLTFKNCWFVPAVLEEFISRMEKLELRRLRLESVSLIAAGGNWIEYEFDTIGWPAGFPEQRQPMSTPVYVGFGVPQPSAHNVVSRDTVIWPVLDADGKPCLVSDAKWHDQKPQRNTWANLIDTFTPGLTVEESRATYLAKVGQKRKRSDGEAVLQTEAKRDKIPIIEFESCGYAKLAVQDLGETLNRMVALKGCSRLKKRHEKLDPVMMKSDDPFLAEILPFLSRPEKMLLAYAFGMRIGWGNDRRAVWNEEDARRTGGRGRFSGVLSESSGPVCWDADLLDWEYKGPLAGLMDTS